MSVADTEPTPTRTIHAVGKYTEVKRAKGAKAVITSITMKGIKGITAKQELTGRDIIIGSNGSGKTTRTQALGISLLGYVPGGAKLPAETMKLASSDSMEVGIETDDCFIVSRKFKRGNKSEGADSKGADNTQVSQTITITPKGNEKTAAQKEQRIESTLGKLPMMLDFNEFLALSDMKRREFIFTLMGQDDTQNISELGDKIESLIVFPNDIDPKEAEILILCIESLFSESATKGGETPLTYQEGLTLAFEHAKTQASHWRKERDKAEGASQKLADYKNELEQTDRNLDANKKKLDAITTEHLTATNELTRLIGENNQRTHKNTRIVSKRTAIAQAEKDDTVKNAAAINLLIKEYKEGLRQIDNHAAIQECSALIAEQQEELPILEQKLEELLRGYQDKSAKINSNKFIIIELKNHKGKCPLDSRLECHQDFTEFLLRLSAENQTLKDELNILQTQGTEARAALNQAKEFIANRQEDIATLQKEEVETLRENEGIMQVVRELEADLKKPENDDTARAAWVTALQEELNELLPKDGKSEWEIIPTAALEGRIETLKQEITALKSTIDTQTKARNELINLRRSIIDNTEAGYKADSWKRIAEAVGPKGLQGELVKNALTPLSKDIQTKLRQMGIEDREFYFETENSNGKEMFQFGWAVMNHDKKTLTPCNFDALSTGEQMLLLIAMMTTIIERINPPLKILAIDGIEVLDKSNMQRVLSGLITAGKDFDNIILLGLVDAGEYSFIGWKVWDLDGGEL